VPVSVAIVDGPAARLDLIDELGARGVLKDLSLLTWRAPALITFEGPLGGPQLGRDLGTERPARRVSPMRAPPPT
jgi:hypothetical protein